MDVLNNREIAIAIWLIVIAAYICFSEKMIEVRVALKNLAFVFRSRPLLIIFSAAVMYAFFMVYLLLVLDIWNIDQLKNTVFWFFSVGLLSVYNLEKIKADPNFFKNSVIGNVKLLAILQFVIGVYSLPLIMELFLVPLMAVVGVMISIAESDPKYMQVKRLLNGIVITFGLFTLAYTVYMLATDFKELGQEKTLYDFIVPALLTVMYLPFLFAMMMFSTYEMVFVRLQLTMQDRKLRRLAKFYALALINLRLGDLRRWVDHIARVEVVSHKQLVSTFAHMRKLRKLERLKPDVADSQGWSPYRAKDFLLSEGVVTGFYDFYSVDQWYASSKMCEFGEGLYCDNYSYYIEGVEGIAKVLKIKMNVNDISRASHANEKFLVLVGVLIKKSIGIDISDALKNALRIGIHFRESHGDKKIIVRKENWEGHTLGGYVLKFEVIAKAEHE
jgi:hypothetical protein